MKKNRLQRILFVMVIAVAFVILVYVKYMLWRLEHPSADYWMFLFRNSN